MPIIAQRDGRMTGAYVNGLPTNLRAEATRAIDELQYAQLWGPPGALTPANPTLAVLSLAGYDSSGEMILRITVLNVRGANVLATVKVSPTAQATLTPGPRRNAQEAEILRVVKSALYQSLGDFRNDDPHIWLVTGTPSS